MCICKLKVTLLINSDLIIKKKMSSSENKFESIEMSIKKIHFELSRVLKFDCFSCYIMKKQEIEFWFKAKDICAAMKVKRIRFKDYVSEKWIFSWGDLVSLCGDVRIPKILPYNTTFISDRGVYEFLGNYRVSLNLKEAFKTQLKKVSNELCEARKYGIRDSDADLLDDHSALLDDLLDPSSNDAVSVNEAPFWDKEKDVLMEKNSKLEIALSQAKLNHRKELRKVQYESFTEISKLNTELITKTSDLNIQITKLHEEQTEFTKAIAELENKCFVLQNLANSLLTNSVMQEILTKQNIEGIDEFCKNLELLTQSFEVQSQPHIEIENLDLLRQSSAVQSQPRIEIENPDLLRQNSAVQSQQCKENYIVVHEYAINGIGKIFKISHCETDSMQPDEKFESSRKRKYPATTNNNHKIKFPRKTTPTEIFRKKTLIINLLFWNDLQPIFPETFYGIKWVKAFKTSATDMRYLTESEIREKYRTDMNFNKTRLLQLKYINEDDAVVRSLTLQENACAKTIEMIDQLCVR